MAYRYFPVLILLGVIPFMSVCACSGSNDADTQSCAYTNTACTEGVPIIHIESPPLQTVNRSSTAKTDVVAIDLTRQSADIWQRIRNGFAMQELSSSLVEQQQSRYLNNKAFLIQLLTRARPYLYLIVEEIEKRHMPTELALLPIIESAYNPMALSPAKASGLWQFIPSTGKSYGLEQNWWVDERRDIIASTEAALNYLQYIYNMHGDWQLALASYNWGENAVDRAITKNENLDLPTDYANLSMPDETRHYVPKLQALKNIIAFPDRYGVELPHIPNTPYLSVIRKTRSIDVKLAAKLAEMPLADFLALNPAYKRPIIPGSDDGVHIVLPEDRIITFISNLENYKGVHGSLTSWTSYTLTEEENIAALAKRLGTTAATLRAANGLTKKTQILPANVTILVPMSSMNNHSSNQAHNTNSANTDNTEHSENGFDADAVSSAVYPAPAFTESYPDEIDIAKRLTNPPVENLLTEGVPKTVNKPKYYTVKKNDTLGLIAKRHHLTLSQLKRMNGLKTNTVRRGQRLKVGSVSVAQRSSISRSAKRTAAVSRTHKYTVKRGDTLSSIARKYGISIHTLKNNNRLKRNQLYAGQRLTIKTTSG